MTIIAGYCICNDCILNGLYQLLKMAGGKWGQRLKEFAILRLRLQIGTLVVDKG